MNANKYQKLAHRTARVFDKDPEKALLIMTLGVAGEAGEIAEYVKKGIGHSHGIDDDKLVEELMDLQWYIAEILTLRGLKLGDSMKANVEKLLARYPNGFSPEKSINRVETTPVLTGQPTKDKSSEDLSVLSATLIYHPKGVVGANLPITPESNADLLNRDVTDMSNMPEYHVTGDSPTRNRFAPDWDVDMLAALATISGKMPDEISKVLESIESKKTETLATLQSWGLISPTIAQVAAAMNGAPLKKFLWHVFPHTYKPNGKR